MFSDLSSRLYDIDSLNLSASTVSMNANSFQNGSTWSLESTHVYVVNSQSMDGQSVIASAR